MSPKSAGGVALFRGNGTSSGKISGSGGTSGTTEFPFPEVSYGGSPVPKAGSAKTSLASASNAVGLLMSPTSPMSVRPSTASAVVTLSPSGGINKSNNSSNDNCASPKSFTHTSINAIKHSPEAQRCADLVDKVALLSADLEHLKLQSAKEFLSIPSEGSAKGATAGAGGENQPEKTDEKDNEKSKSHSPASSSLVPTKVVVSVTSKLTGVPPSTARATSPASIPRTAINKAAAEAIARVKPPIHSRAASNGRVSRAAVSDKLVADTTTGSGSNSSSGSGVAGNARLVLTPLDVNAQKKAAAVSSAATVTSGSSSRGEGITPRRSSGSSTGSSSGSGRSSSAPRGNAQIPGPARQFSGGGGVNAPPNPVLRSNSMSQSQKSSSQSQGTASPSKTVSSPRAHSKPSTASNCNQNNSANNSNKSHPPASPTGSAKVKNGSSGAALQGKTMKLELPLIPQHKRSQNQIEDPGAGRSRTSSSSSNKSPLLSGEILIKTNSVGSSAQGKLSVIV
eukprot:CAMPEP_0170386016 /NCGR_PEP_ID=MMETSP0117_2-20130122/16812_1 /TAXON_ID=400756 /ORGANISM="Durinskia baltica, Strain CSIRO CS-38" /LENGTH=508 /DNA_ID=CAMNT_0010641815 /DNA_START=29 /DNA_END=1555 /DNA_ORIENTATION=-